MPLTATWAISTFRCDFSGTPVFTPQMPLIGRYRFHPDAINSPNMPRYNERCDKIIESELKFIRWAAAVRVVRRVSSAVKNLPNVRGIWEGVALKSRYRLAWPDRPPVVVDQENKWVIRGTSWRPRPI